MNKRINILLPEETIKVLDRVAPKGDRSRFISRAVLYYVNEQSKANVRELLNQQALENAASSLEMAEEWFPLENEEWQRLDQEERQAKVHRSGAKSISRSSTRRSGTR